MNQIDELRVRIQSLSRYDDVCKVQTDLAAAIQSSTHVVELMPDVFQLFERFPDDDFGMPGELTHVLEGAFGNEYVRELVASLRRCPTPQTLLMARRIRGPLPDAYPELVDVLKDVSMRLDLPHGIRRMAEES